MLSIVIPTLNRPAFLARTLTYLRAEGFSGPILVGDGNGTAEDICAEFGAKHVHCAWSNQQATFGRLADAVETRYAVYCGDDDFLIPSSLDACVQALEKNDDFTCARGHAMTISANGVHGIPYLLEPYEQPELLQELPGLRVLAALQDYRVALFSVHRTNVWKEMFRVARTMQDKWMGAEIAPSIMSAALGRTLVLEIPYLARQIHIGRYGGAQGEEWFTSAAVQSDARFLVEQLCGETGERHRIWRALYAYLVGYVAQPASVPKKFWRAYDVLGKPWFDPIYRSVRG